MTAQNRLATLVMGLCLTVVGMLWAWDFFHDDAFITLRYVERLLAGDGLTWSAGRPVEGFTHPLWTFQLAALGACGIDLETASRWLGVAYVVALVLFWARVGLWSLPLFALLLHASFLLWSVSGLESASFTFWCIVSTWLCWRTRGEPARRGLSFASGGAFAALALCRPEGAAIALLLLVWLWTGTTRRNALHATVVFALPVAAYLCFRWFYYGDLLPNTAYAKLSASLGYDRLAERAWEQLAKRAKFWVPGLATVAIGLWQQPRSPAWLALIVSLPVWISFVSAGGDHMLLLRPLVPALGLSYLALAMLNPDTSHSRPTPMMATLVGICIGVNAVSLDSASRWVERDGAAEIGEVVGKLFESELPPNTLVAVATAGSTAYFAPGLDFIDTVGLNDYTIARREHFPIVTDWQGRPGHLKGDANYVLSRQPDVIVLGPAEGFLGEVPTDWFLTDYELLHSPEFRTHYEPYEFKLEPVRETVSPRLRRRIRKGLFRLYAYLRRGAETTKSLAARGQAVRPPWQSAAGE